MKKIFAVLAVALSSQAALAADIFVREAKGVDMTSIDKSQVTDAVKNAIRSMPEHNLVFSETSADLVLQPALVKKGSQNVLRLQAIQGSDVIATNEQPLPPKAGGQQISGVTRFALSRLPPQITQGQSAQASNQGLQGQEPQAPQGMQEPSVDHGTGSVSGSTGGVSPNGAATDSHQQRSLSRGARGTQDTTSQSATTTDESTMGGETRGAAPQPSTGLANRAGYFTLGAGPAVSVGLNSDNVLYGLTAGYNVDFNERIGGKVFGNLDMGSGSDSSRMINIGAGANLYFPEAAIARGRPYLTADVGYGNARRNKTDDLADGVAIGAGGGFQFAAQNLNMDLLLRYQILTSQIRDNTPSILGINLAVNF
jgi:hypothetical protein